MTLYEWFPPHHRAEYDYLCRQNLFDKLRAV
jgi:hypothetical protein